MRASGVKMNQILFACGLVFNIDMPIITQMEAVTKPFFADDAIEKSVFKTVLYFYSVQIFLV